tara:strand:+ start:97 stop:750 length:654 start_codon:yes stop_codon:yes gene_type:complete
MLTTRDFLKINFRNLNIDSALLTNQIPLSVDEYRKLPILRQTELNYKPNGSNYLEYSIEFGVDLHPKLHAEWTLMFTNLVAKENPAPSSLGLRIVRVSENEVFLTDHTNPDHTNHTFMKAWSQRNLKKWRNDVNTRRISTYWDQLATDSNLERRQKEDYLVYQEMIRDMNFHTTEPKPKKTEAPIEKKAPAKNAAPITRSQRGAPLRRVRSTHNECS